MANSLMQYMCYLIMLSICIDEGDGRWKERDKGNLKHDIMIYKNMAEKIEREIEAFYDEYPDEWLKGDNVDRIGYKHLTNTLDRNRKTTKGDEHTDSGKHNYFFTASSGKTNDIPSESITKKQPFDKSNNTLSFHNVSESINVSRPSSADWPKFEDILLAIGRKYDWKNDRWIKVKEKLKKINNEIMKTKANTVDFHEKHKFSYRIVKLNRSKSRRNVVVAVSAVR